MVPTPDIDGCLEELCLQKVSAYASGGAWHVVGEVINNGEGADYRTSNIQIEVLFKDETGFVVGNGTGVAEMTVLPGANDEPQFGTNVTPFHVEVFSQEEEWATYSVEIVSATVPSGGGIVRNLNLGIPNESMSNETYTATGTVNNTSGHAYSGVRVIVALYQQGTVVRVASADLSPSNLADAASGTFSITISDAPMGEYESEFWVDGSEAD